MAKSSGSKSSGISVAAAARARNTGVAATPGVSASQAAKSSKASSTTSSNTSSVPAGGRIVSGRIYDSSGKYVGMSSGSTPTTTTTPASPVSYSFTNKNTGVTTTVTADQLAKMSKATKDALASQVASGAITGTSGGKSITASTFSTPVTTQTQKVTPNTQQTNIITQGKTISQDAYDSFVAKAKAQGKTDTEISSALSKSGLTITPTQSVQSNKPGDVLNTKQTVTAPNGKIYEVIIDKDGKASFTSQGGMGTRTFNSLEEALNTIKTSNPPSKVPVVPEIYEDPKTDRLKDSESDIQGINEITDFAQETQDTALQAAQDQMDMLKKYIDQFAQYDKQMANKMDSTITQRFQSMNDNFSAISQSIKDLETKANDLFDVNAMIARQSRAKQLADAGILSSEQASSAAQYSMQDYTMNVELKRSELMQQAQEAMTNALKEKGQLEDQILQQQGIDAVTKQNMVQQVNTMYQNMINGYAEKVNTANAAYDNAIQTARAKQVEVDLQRKLPLIQEEAAKELNATQKASANSDPQYRYDYVLNKFGEIDANLKSFVANLMGTYKNNGTFMSQDIDTFISELAKKAQAAYKSYNTTSTSSSSSVGNTSGTQTTGTPSGTQTSSSITEETWTPSTVGLNLGYQPKITYNPLTMSNIPIQSTIGGA